GGLFDEDHHQDSETDVNAAEHPGDVDFQVFPVESNGAVHDWGRRFIDHHVSHIEIGPSQAEALLLQSQLPSVESASGRTAGIRLRCRRGSSGRAPRTGEREGLALEKSVETECEPLTGLGSVSVRGWLRVVVMVGFGLVSWLVGVGDGCHRSVDPVGFAWRFWSGLELYLVAPPGTWFEEQGFCRV